MAESIEFSFVCGEFPEDTFSVLGFSGTEAISQLYRFDIDLVSDDPDVDIDDLQDQASTLRIEMGARERRIQGILSEVEVLDQAGEHTIYRVALVPRVWELTLGTASLVHLDQTTPQVIQTALEQQLGITSADCDLQVEESAYRPWPFRLQYGESHWDYLSRLMERDGIYYYFTAGEEVERIAFCDAWGKQPRLEEASFHYSPTLGIDPDVEGHTVDSFVMRQRRVPKRVTVQNYNDDMPSTPIRESEEVDPRGTGAVNLYGQTVLDPDEAKAIAAIRAEELRCPKVTYEGTSTAFELAAAHRFDLEGHDRQENNREYQVLRVEHSAYNSVLAGKVGRQKAADTPVYENRFTAIAAERQFRAERKTGWPEIRGTINAVVDAQGTGKYAELDEEGRYHVVFPFHEGFHSGARADAGKASYWVRMMQPFGGAQEGMHMPLRKGTRVLVGFVGGNPDLPVITGTVPTAEHRSVVDSDEPTRGRIFTPGGNQIETDDNEGRERLFLYSSNSNTRVSLGADQHDLDGAASVGASSTTSSTSPTADGMELDTSGMLRIGSFGGTNYMQTTSQWAIANTLWSDSKTQRDNELAHDDNDMSQFKRDFEDGDGWSVSDGPDRVFRFPRKHKLPSDAPDAASDEDGYEDFITKEEEAEERLHITRVLGEGYHFHSGSSFHFWGQDSEAFSFGPTAAYASTDHGEGVDELYELISGTIPEFAEGFTPNDWEEKYAKLDQLRVELNEARKEHDKRNERRNELDAQAAAFADANPFLADPDGYGSGFSMSDESLRLFTDEKNENDEKIFEEWAKLDNRDTSRNKGWEEFTNDGTTYYRVDLEEMPTGDGSGNRVGGSVVEAQDELNQKDSQYDRLLGSMPCDPDEEPEDRSWVARVRTGWINAKHGDEFRWHTGNVYDFGGFWDYNLGNGYTENHIDQQAELNKSGHPYDLPNVGGPAWTSITAAPELGGGLKQETMSVEKSFGDSYEYSNGRSIEVHVGGSQEISQGTIVEERYSGADQRVFKEVAKEGVKQAWRNHPDSGVPLAYETSTWEGGHNSFSTSFVPSISLDIKADYSQSTSLTVGVSNDVSLDVGYRHAIGIFVGGKSEIDIGAAIIGKLELSASVTMDLNKSAAGHVNYDNGEIDIKLGAFEFTNKPPTALEKKVTALENRQAGIATGVLDVLSKMQVSL